jgi:hypothetical protein
MPLKCHEMSVQGGLDGARLILLNEASKLCCILGGGMVAKCEAMRCSIMYCTALHIEVLGKRQEVWLPIVADHSN